MHTEKLLQLDLLLTSMIFCICGYFLINISTYKKQTGGAGQFGKVEGYIEPIIEGDPSNLNIEFLSTVTGGNIPTNFIPACEKVALKFYMFLINF